MRSYMLFIIALLCATSSQGQGIINTVAGNGSKGNGADNIPAIYTALRGYTHKLVVGPDGYWYIADSNRIRRIEPISNIITTFAGSDIAGFSGDGGPAANALFNFICYLAFSPTGDLYLTDMSNHRVRKINMQTGIVTTVAGNGASAFSGDGGPATGASLHNPYAIVFDRDSNMVVSDIGNFRVRKIDHNGIISTIGGNGTSISSGDGGPAINAGIVNGGGMVVDTANNIYIECYVDYRIRKIDQATGIITTYAGTGNGQANGDGGPASSANIGATDDIAMDRHGNLYIPDYDNHTIRKVDAATGIISTIAGTGTAGYNGNYTSADTTMLNQPTKISVDSCDNIYFSEMGSNLVRRISYDHCGELDVKAITKVPSFSFYPNPASSELHLASNSKIETVTIVDLYGRVVFTTAGNNDNIIIDISGLSSGVYFLNVNSAITKKFVKL